MDITFADRLQQISIQQGIARLTFAVQPDAESGNADETAPPVPTVRIAMPLAAMLQMYGVFGNMIADLEKQGLIKRTDPAAAVPATPTLVTPTLVATSGSSTGTSSRVGVQPRLVKPGL